MHNEYVIGWNTMDDKRLIVKVEKVPLLWHDNLFYKDNIKKDKPWR